MNRYYEDILNRIDVPPLWWDENAVPRYVEFGPDKVANIYADEAALVLIACQDCRTEFNVAFSMSRTRELVSAHCDGRKPTTLADEIKKDRIFYGDPPNNQCCAAGPTMTSNAVMVLEYWCRSDGFSWARDKSLEVPLSS